MASPAFFGATKPRHSSSRSASLSTYTYSTMSRFFRRGGDSSDEESSSEEEELLSQESDSDDDAPKPAKTAAAAKPMSRFLRTEGDDSDSDSDSDEDSDSDDSGSGNEVEKPVKKASRFLKGAASDDESSEEEVKVIVKSAKDKRNEEMETSGSLIEQKVKINDWAAINTGMPILLVTSALYLIMRSRIRQADPLGATANEPWRTRAPCLPTRPHQSRLCPF